MLSFTELDADFNDENLNPGRADDDADTFASPTEIARPTRRKGLTQQTIQKQLDFMEEEEVHDHGGFGDDFGGGFGDDSFEYGDAVDDIPQEEEGDLDDVEDKPQEEEEEEEDIYGRQATPPPPIKRGKGRPRVSEKPAKPSTGRKRTKSASTQPAAKGARTTSAAPHFPKIIERKEIPHPADLSMMDGDGTPHF
jgi:hypothetical protein